MYNFFNMTIAIGIIFALSGVINIILTSYANNINRSIVYEIDKISLKYLYKWWMLRFLLIIVVFIIILYLQSPPGAMAIVVGSIINSIEIFLYINKNNKI